MSHFEMIKDMTGGDWAALVQNVGGPEAAKGIAAGKFRVELIENKPVLVDKTGRRIPPQGMKAAHT
ncbi:MAG: hypothetical protein AAB817_00770, partial [Patescibacteria group bacterium]